MNDKQLEMWNALCNLDGEQVARLFTDYHGLQLLDDGFYEHMVEEGHLDEPEEEPDGERILAEADDFDDFCSQFTACNGCPFELDHSAECEELFERKKEVRV